jgi:hypothetical protein
MEAIAIYSGTLPITSGRRKALDHMWRRLQPVYGEPMVRLTFTNNPGDEDSDDEVANERLQKIMADVRERRLAQRGGGERS